VEQTRTHQCHRPVSYCEGTLLRHCFVSISYKGYLWLIKGPERIWRSETLVADVPFVPRWRHVRLTARQGVLMQGAAEAEMSRTSAAVTGDARRFSSLDIVDGGWRNGATLLCDIGDGALYPLNHCVEFATASQCNCRCVWWTSNLQ